MWQRQYWFISGLIGALFLIFIFIYLCIYVQQLVLFLIALILAAAILFSIGVSVFYISRKISKRCLDENDRRYINIIFAGTIIIALSQLFGPLFGAFYPLILGPDASDYNLAFSSMYYNVTFNDSTLIYDITSPDTPVQHYPHDPNQKSEQINFHTKISAINLNPIMVYEDEIFLDLIPPNKVNASVKNPVIKIDQSSDVIISLNPDPGTYPIKVQGEGADGKVRKAMTVIGVSKPINGRWYTPSGPHEFTKDSLEGAVYAGMMAGFLQQPNNVSTVKDGKDIVTARKLLEQNKNDTLS
jgi:hypothetical protein